MGGSRSGGGGTGGGTGAGAGAGLVVGLGAGGGGWILCDLLAAFGKWAGVGRGLLFFVLFLVYGDRLGGHSGDGGEEGGSGGDDIGIFLRFLLSCTRGTNLSRHYPLRSIADYGIPVTLFSFSL